MVMSFVWLLMAVACLWLASLRPGSRRAGPPYWERQALMALVIAAGCALPYRPLVWAASLGYAYFVCLELLGWPGATHERV